MELGSPRNYWSRNNEYFIASDASPFVEFTKGSLSRRWSHGYNFSRKWVDIRSIKENEKIEPAVQELKLSLEQIGKGRIYEHFIFKRNFRTT